MWTRYKTVLQQADILQGLPASTQQEIVQMAVIFQFQVGDFVFMQGDPATKLHLLLQGEARIRQANYLGDTVLLRIIAPGKQFGCFTAFNMPSYPASAVVKRPSITLAWSYAQVESLSAKYPRFLHNMGQFLITRIQRLQSDLLSVTSQTAEVCLAKILFQLSQSWAKPHQQGVLLDLSLSRQDLADMLGLTLHTVSRTFSKWHKQGLVCSGREKIIICQPEALFEIANVELVGEVGVPSSVR